MLLFRRGGILGKRRRWSDGKREKEGGQFGVEREEEGGGEASETYLSRTNDMRHRKGFVNVDAAWYQDEGGA